MNEQDLREQIALHGRSLFERGYTCGSSGNISVKVEDGILITPTNSCMGRLNPKQISKINLAGEHLTGDKPSKEAFLHLAMYRSRPLDTAIVHLHSTWSVAVSCLAEINLDDVLPPVTAYYLMRVGKLPLIPFYLPGDQELAAAVESTSLTSRAVLLANHGPVLSAGDLDSAVYGIEELEETAKLYLLLKDQPVRYLTPTQVNQVKERFTN